MAISETKLSIRYEANGDTTSYEISFPFLDPAHIYAATTDGVAEPVLLSQTDFTVTRKDDGTGGILTLDTAIGDPLKLIIFRSIPLTQPTVFQPAGPFPAKSNETALDRLLMQVQQLNRRINELAGINDPDYVEVPSSDPNASRDVATWATSAERGTVRPSWPGQLGVERSTGTVWIGKSLNIGDWYEFRPIRTNQLVIGLVADAGLKNAPQQTAIANLVTTKWNCDAVLFAGDNNYTPTPQGYADDWAAFDSIVSAGKAYPALGNHDLDNETWQALHDGKFTYLPGNRRYYNVVLGNGLVELFVLNSGYDTNFDLTEPDGNSVTSVQHDWFVDQVEASPARWKIAMFHHPPVTHIEGDNRIATAMSWPELTRMDLVVCGHTHALEIVKWRDTMLVNPSASVHTPRPLEGEMQGTEEDVATAWPLWGNDEHRGLGRVVATQDKLEVEIWRTDGALLHARSHDDFTPRPCLQETYQMLAHDASVGFLPARYVGTIASPALLRRVMIAVAVAGDNKMSWQLQAGAVQVAAGILPEGEEYMVAPSLIPLDMIPRGTQLRLTTSDIYGGGAPNAKGLDVTLFSQRYH